MASSMAPAANGGVTRRWSSSDWNRCVRPSFPRPAAAGGGTTLPDGDDASEDVFGDTTNDAASWRNGALTASFGYRRRRSVGETVATLPAMPTPAPDAEISRHPRRSG